MARRSSFYLHYDDQHSGITWRLRELYHPVCVQNENGSLMFGRRNMATSVEPLTNDVGGLKKGVVHHHYLSHSSDKYYGIYPPFG
ncbi:hypothetical protein AVEN_152944-1 [Araneus ventricosus]|uniref:Uncharacterized protein n=1 Tax=Araneus ventricosus TaxID=182803 RepID=A0A4Y2AD91_ARAVE|nr:hypothetical protein AVEN_152944-1 [Araneus ventricosus]